MSSLSNQNHYLFTSESLGEGPPALLCDQVSDAVLDYCLSLDPDVHVACESFSTTDFLLVGGEIGFQNYKVNPKEFNANIEKIARQVADAVLDYRLSLEPDVHVACESYSTTDVLLVGGEIGF